MSYYVDNDCTTLVMDQQMNIIDRFVDCERVDSKATSCDAFNVKVKVLFQV